MESATRGVADDEDRFGRIVDDRFPVDMKESFVNHARFVRIGSFAEFVSGCTNLFTLDFNADRSFDSGESIDRRDQKIPRSARRFDRRRGFGTASRRQRTNALGEIGGRLKIAVFIGRRRS